jgi:hypothetical protein
MPRGAIVPGQLTYSEKTMSATNVATVAKHSDYQSISERHMKLAIRRREVYARYRDAQLDLRALDHEMRELENRAAAVLSPR